MTSLEAGILFDLDGTLVDTNYLHTLAWSRAFRDSGEWAPMNAIHRLIGMGGDRLPLELLGHENEQAVARRPVHYRELMIEAKPFGYAQELLRAARARGIAVVLATSAVKDELNAMIDLLGIGDVLQAVTSADDVGVSKPEPDVFLTAMKAGGVDPRRALAVGDSIWDVRAAGAAGLACIGVESGGSSRHELAEAGAAAVYRDVGQLYEQLDVSLVAHLGARG